MSVCIQPEYRDLAREIFECRSCRERWPEFARETGPTIRHPEMAQGSPAPTILIVSINPKLDDEREVEVDLDAFLRRATSPAFVNESNDYDRALAKALPASYSLRNGNVANTRV